MYLTLTSEFGVSPVPVAETLFCDLVEEFKFQIHRTTESSETNSLDVSMDTSSELLSCVL